MRARTPAAAAHTRTRLRTTMVTPDGSLSQNWPGSTAVISPSATDPRSSAHERSV
jgi:hypothetical protein